MPNQLTFQNQSLEIHTCKEGEWIRGAQIGQALNYTDPLRKITHLYSRNKSEFTPSMVCRLRVKTNGGTQEVLAFSLRGAHLLAMFSRTPVAKEFRKWVLDILEEKTQQDAITRITPEQAGQLQKAVKAKVAQLGCATHFQRIWSAHNCHFGIDSYKNLPAVSFRQALEFIQSYKTQAEQPSLPRYSEISPHLEAAHFRTELLNDYISRCTLPVPLQQFVTENLTAIHGAIRSIGAKTITHA